MTLRALCISQKRGIRIRLMTWRALSFSPCRLQRLHHHVRVGAHDRGAQQGLTLFHFSAQRKHFQWDILGGFSDKTAQAKPTSGQAYSSTFQLNVSAFCGIRWVVSVTKRLRLSRQVDECIKALPRSGSPTRDEQKGVSPAARYSSTLTSI